MAVFSVVVVTAAPPGQASDAGGAFVKIDGREALLRSIELFVNRDNVKQVILVVLPEAADDTRRRYASHLALMGVKLLTGGPTWEDQLAATADHIAPEATHVIVHDAARPIVAYTDIDSLMAEAAKHPAVVLASALRSGLVEVDEGAHPVAYHRPARFMELLTPQAYSRDVFLEHARTRQEPHASRVRLIKGSPLNVRCAGPGDERLLKGLLGMLPKPKKAPLNPFEEAQW